MSGISATALNAYVGPILTRYLERLTGAPGERRVSRPIADHAVQRRRDGARDGCALCLSHAFVGTGGRPVAGIFCGTRAGHQDLITMDMGGTSFDVSFIKNGQVSFTTEGSVGGHAMAFPVLDIRTVGAGGGSIAVVDEGGVLQVGPASAGADPGPICYGRGGTAPTVTDADLVLGYLGADDFLGGKFRLDLAAAENGIAEKIAGPLAIDSAACSGGHPSPGQYDDGRRHSISLDRRRARPAPVRADRRRRRRRGARRGDRGGVGNSSFADSAQRVGFLRGGNAFVGLEA